MKKKMLHKRVAQEARNNICVGDKAVKEKIDIRFVLPFYRQGDII